jgi:pimeloyl-ACP methyl ester carboxylesterase
MSRPGRLTAAVDYYRANIGMLLQRSWAPVQVPVMGVWSDGDAFLCEQQMTNSPKYMAAPFRYERINGANHWLQLTAPEKVNALLLDFLA